MQPQAVRINTNENHERNGSAHMLDMVEVGSGGVVDFEIVGKETVSRCGDYEGSRDGMELKLMRRMAQSLLLQPIEICKGPEVTIVFSGPKALYHF
jgi:gamma-glutamyl-gamma-aminobutyrate hydrolase PuuD